MAGSKKSLKVGEIVFVAAECRGIAKVGGLGDVVRDLGASFTQRGEAVSVLMPFYGSLDLETKEHARLAVEFAGREFEVGLESYELADGLKVWLVSSREWFDGVYRDVYVDSARLGHGPFEDDATRFAFFSQAVMEIFRTREEFAGLEVLHCHDWHTGPLLTLLNLDDRYASLKKRFKTIFTIHNLDYQGSRPWRGDEGGRPGSFGSWFLSLGGKLLNNGQAESLSDPQDRSCYSPMRAAIRLAGLVTTVSPTYAREITQPDDPARNFVGGRGLESDLAQLAAEGRLPGILNGIDYNEHDPAKLELDPYGLEQADWAKRRKAGRKRFAEDLPSWVEGLAEKHGERFFNRGQVSHGMRFYDPLIWKNRTLFVAVTRTAAQKFGIILSRMPDGRTLLEHVLDKPLALLILGSGELDGWIDALTQRPNALFLNLFDARAAARLYAVGDVFLMPSDFEPCGISQMISLRYACLPLVHDIGGLHDTIEDGRTGFKYSGGDLVSQQRALLKTIDRAIWSRENRPDKWEAMQEAAMKERFSWSGQAEKYLEYYARLGS